MPLPKLGDFAVDNLKGENAEELIDAIEKHRKELYWLLQNLDTENVGNNGFDGSVLKTGMVDANRVKIKSTLENGAFIEITDQGLIAHNGREETFIIDVNGRVSLKGSMTIQDLEHDWADGSYLHINSEGLYAYDGTKKKISFSINQEGQTFFSGNLAVIFEDPVTFEDTGTFSIDSSGVYWMDAGGNLVFGINDQGEAQFSGALSLNFQDQGSVYIGPQGLSISNGTNTPFFVDPSGNAVFSGSINLSFVDDSGNATGGGVSIDERGLFASKGGEDYTFYIDENGNAYFKGTMNFDFVDENGVDNGSFSINPSGLFWNDKDGNLVFGINDEGNAQFTGDIRLDFADNGYFYVGEQGMMANNGTINTFLVDSSGNAVFGGSINVNFTNESGTTTGGVSIDQNGIYALNGEDVVFSISNTGQAMFNGAMGITFDGGGQASIGPGGFFLSDSSGPIFAVDNSGSAHFGGSISIGTAGGGNLYLGGDGMAATNSNGQASFMIDSEGNAMFSGDFMLAFDGGGLFTIDGQNGVLATKANGQPTFQIANDGTFYLNGEINIFGKDGSIKIDQYGIDPDFVKKYKNVVHNSSFEAYDASTNRPLYWSGGQSTQDASWDNSRSMVLQPGETSTQQKEGDQGYFVNLADIQGATDVRISFYMKSPGGGSVSCSLFGQSFTASSTDWDRHDFVATPGSTEERIIPSFTNNSSVPVYIDSVQAEPGSGGDWSSFYTDGPNSSPAENIPFQTSDGQYKFTHTSGSYIEVGHDIKIYAAGKVYIDGAEGGETTETTDGGTT